jgi:hypothetical protein
MAGIRIGTSAFTAAGWNGSFYPRRMKPAAGTLELFRQLWRKGIAGTHRETAFDV